jgi:hypothetical protein
VIGCVHEKVRDGRLVDEAALRFALAGVDDLLDEIRAARLLRAAAPENVQTARGELAEALRSKCARRRRDS